MSTVNVLNRPTWSSTDITTWEFWVERSDNHWWDDEIEPNIKSFGIWDVCSALWDSRGHVQKICVSADRSEGYILSCAQPNSKQDTLDLFPKRPDDCLNLFNQLWHSDFSNLWRGRSGYGQWPCSDYQTGTKLACNGLTVRQWSYRHLLSSPLGCKAIGQGIFLPSCRFCKDQGEVGPRSGSFWMAFNIYCSPINIITSSHYHQNGDISYWSSIFQPFGPRKQPIMVHARQWECSHIINLLGQENMTNQRL